MNIPSQRLWAISRQDCNEYRVGLFTTVGQAARTEPTIQIIFLFFTLLEYSAVVDINR